MIEILPDERIEHSIDGSTFILQFPSPEVLGKAKEKNTRITTNPEGLEVKEMDDFGFMMDVLDSLIVDWKNVKHPITKTDVPCTSENKRRLPLAVIDELVSVWTGQIDVVLQRQEAEVKNLKGSSD